MYFQMLKVFSLFPSFLEVTSSLEVLTVKLSAFSTFGLLRNCALWSYLSCLWSAKQKAKSEKPQKRVLNGKLDAIKIHLGATSLCAAPNCRQVLCVLVAKCSDTLADN